MTLRQVTLVRQDESAVTFRDVEAGDDAAAMAMALKFVNGGGKDWRAFLVHEIRNAAPTCERVVMASRKTQKKAQKMAQPCRDLFGGM